MRGSHIRLLTIVSFAAGCQVTSQNTGSSDTFELGGVTDPVMRMALEPSERLSINITIRNNTDNQLGWGLVTTSPIAPLGSVPATEFADYLAGRTTQSSTSRMAVDLGYTMGDSAFVVRPVGQNRTRRATISVTAGSELYYTAVVKRGATTANDDFVATTLAIDAVTSQLATVNLEGFALVGGTVTLGNTTTGASPDADMTAAEDVDCSGGNLAEPSDLFLDDFTNGANDPLWPSIAGWTGDFNGDWYTDGQTARLYSPNWAGVDPLAPPPPVMSGIVRFIDVCAQNNSSIDISIDAVTSFTSNPSDTSLILYFFRDNNLLNVEAIGPLAGDNTFTLGSYLHDIPLNTNRIAVVPLIYISDNTDQGTAFFDNLSVTYWPNGAIDSTVLMGDTFDNYGSSPFGDNQPVDWEEFGGDWYAYPSENWATLWNPTWGGDQSELPPIDTGMTRTVSLAGAQATDQLTLEAFVASTFSDPNSFVQLRMIFDTGETVESGRLNGASYGQLVVPGTTIPAGATEVTVVVNAYMADNETESLYVDDVVLTRLRSTHFE